MDDNPTYHRLLTLQTKNWGMVAHTVENGAQALALLAGETFDLAMLDLTLPEIDGVALANEIRQRPGTRALPLILLTSLRVRSNLPGLKAAFSNWLTKPVKPAQLDEQLTQVLSGEPPAPRPPEKTPAPAGSEMDAQLASRMPLRILLTDDNLIHQKVATRMLAQLGSKADVAGNGQEALTAAGRQFYDLILMDVQMPHMDGLEATRRLREFQGKKGGRASVVIAMTGDRKKRACQEGRTADALPYHQLLAKEFLHTKEFLTHHRQTLLRA